VKREKKKHKKKTKNGCCQLQVSKRVQGKIVEAGCGVEIDRSWVGGSDGTGTERKPESKRAQMLIEDPCSLKNTCLQGIAYQIPFVVPNAFFII